MKNCYLWRELAVYHLSESECLCVLCSTCQKGWPWGYMPAQGRRVAEREHPTASEEKNNLAVGAGWRLSHGSERGYVKCDTEAQI